MPPICPGGLLPGIRYPSRQDRRPYRRRLPVSGSPGESKLVPFPVGGIGSGPFGIFRGDTNGPDRGLTQPRFSLVLLACGRFLSTPARRIDCQVLAEELAPLEVAWTATDPYAVTGPGIETGPLAAPVLSAPIRTLAS